MRVCAAFVLLAGCLLAPNADAAPEAHILRIDPRASRKSGDPVITTVVEVQQSKRISKATAHCATLTSSSRLRCIADAMEKPLYTPFPFPEQNSIFSVEVDGMDRPAKLVSIEGWGESQNKPGIGTAWLILVDADSRMRGFDDAKELARQFVDSMGPNDIVNVMFFNDRQVFNDSGWLPVARKSQATSFISAVRGTVPKQGRNRPLLTIIKNAATDGFKALGNAGEKVQVPLHQAMVVLSSGYGGADPATTGPGALQLSEYMTGGRFPEDNTVLPKTPVPVISIYYPPRTWDEVANNALEFMQNLANTQIGGYFSIMQDGEGSRSKGIVNAVRTRFSKMVVARWRVSCVAPTITQSFRLVFKSTEPPIAGDATFKDVPLGLDPTTWPLDVDLTKTQAGNPEPIYPGGKVKVFGDFCWGGDTSRAELYFVPAGQAVPADLSGSDPEQAKQAQQHLIAMGMKAEVNQTADTFAEFVAPDNDKLIHGSGSQAVARLVLYDNKAHRTSGATADTIVQLRASSAPFPLLPILGGALGLTVIALLLVIVFSSSRKKRSRSSDSGALRPVQASAPQVPPAPTPANVRQATLRGSEGEFQVYPNMEMRLGRDAARCAIVLRANQVSGLHATLRLESGQLSVRDETSTHGTFVNGRRAVAGQWTVIPHGAQFRVGPSEFRITLE